MSSDNDTGFTPSTFILIGIPGLEAFHTWFASPLCVIYSITLMGNCTLLLAIKTAVNLHKPMYILISLLACSDLVLSTCILPKMLDIFWFNYGEISFSGCLIQMCFIYTFSALESSILSAMAFDRYVAVCNPLRYYSIVNNSLIAKIAAASLTRAVILFVPPPMITMRLPFCSKYIDHSFCGYLDVAKLSCADITVNSAHGLVTFLLVVPVDILFISLSYILILRCVLYLPHKEDRFKAFSTCASHICVISAFYLPFFFTLILHRLHHNIPRSVHVIMGSTCLFLPPLINPLIYGVIMKEVRQAVQKIFQKDKGHL